MRESSKEKGEIDFSTLTASEWFWLILIVLALISILKSYLATQNVDVAEFSPDSILLAFITWYKKIEWIVILIGYTLSAIFLFGLAYAVTRRNYYFALEGELVHPPIPEPVDIYANKKWERVLAHVNSANESDWKLAVLEADIMLDELLDKSGYKGVTMGEKLKQVDKSDFNTLDYAWEGHKIRNLIAHEGSAFAFSQREAQRVVGLYEKVFKEFKYI